MNVSAWSIRNPIPAAMLFFMLTLAGLFSFQQMKVQNFPDLDVPNITVTASLPGAAPNQLENDVARVIENSLASLQGLKHITTKVQDGSVTITTEFRIEKNTQEALDDVRSAVAKVRGDLPADLREPIINKIELAGGAVLAYTVSSDRMDAEAISWFVENDISKLLLSVRGVGAINRVGGVDREVQVLLDPLKLQALGASAADVSRQLAKVQIESAGGRVDLGGSQQPLRTLSSLQSAEALARLELSLPDGRRVRLDQIAEIKDTVAEPTAAAFLDGKPVVGFEVARSRGASEIEVGEGVRAKLKELQAARPDLRITESFDFVTPVKEEFDGSMTLLYEGAILAVLVVWLFLRDFRATVVSAVALPLSAIPAFIGMHYMGFTINVVTLLAMSLVIGILVDDAIVEVENIVRHMRMGKTPYQASMEAADEIGLAVIATTFALIAVFLPTAFMSGIPGKFFKQFGWTASFAVFASLVVARALTPMMAAYLLKPVVMAKDMPRWARSNRVTGA
ncbi:MAG: efflux RND transporter permease subunit, partial [Hydrogenophaga sp.]|nr:efflux RND transporter permease subunit [Hydrogenophaga sp.]